MMVGTVERPTDMFDREWEWSVLTGFAVDPAPGATLGVVSGRRRQGKSYLLEALCAATDGCYFAATEATEVDSLRLLADTIGARFDLPASPSLRSWEQALDVLLALGRERACTVVLDEFPYLCAASPALPSVVQKAFGSRRRERTGSRTRLILCGPALRIMGGLLSGSAPLRGHAGLDLPVATLDYRSAARFWEMTDWRLAVLLHAVVGGTPAYRREYARGDVPRDLGDFDDWVARTVLNPASPLLREARYLLAEEPDLRDKALYHSVLGAVAEGHSTRGGIAAFVGRRDDAVRHPLTVLEDAGFLRREPDIFRTNRSSFQITEPLVTFYHAVMRPEWARLERPGNATTVWRDARNRFDAAVLGPHFERLCRTWTATFADPATLGGPASVVGHGVVNDPARRRTWEVDVAVVGPDGALLAVGEAKWGTVVGLEQLDRLRRVRQLLAAHDRAGAADARLLCFSGTGFTDDLRRAQRAGEVVLIDLERLYLGT